LTRRFRLADRFCGRGQGWRTRRVGVALFYERHPSATPQQLLDHATMIDRRYGSQFRPEAQ